LLMFLASYNLIDTLLYFLYMSWVIEWVCSFC
jgi:hypothetical protein